MLKEMEGDSAPVTQFSKSSSFLASKQVHAVSISMPSSPLGLNPENDKRMSNVSVNHDKSSTNFAAGPPTSSRSASPRQTTQAKSYSVRMQADTTLNADRLQLSDQPSSCLIDSQRDKRTMKSFKSFKTFSGRLERQITMLRGKPVEEIKSSEGPPPQEVEVLPVDRYFDALDGPELDRLKDAEELILPEDQEWPFLLRFPISSFGICLGLSSQAILWKTLSSAPSLTFLHVSPIVNLVLWFASIAIVALISTIYTLKIIFYFEAVRREYYHPIRINFFFAPWIACLFLVMGLPPLLVKTVPPMAWYFLMAPIFCLELNIYGQWMSGGRRLSKVANPSNHLSIVGNFVGALLGATMGLKEGPLFFFAIGFAHYAVLFVTLYQRLPTNEKLPKELHPDLEDCPPLGSRVIGRFSLAWWAYTFPMTGASIATIKYTNEAPHAVNLALSIALSCISSVIVTSLLITTVIHAFVLRDLFPNDIAIAITKKKAKIVKKNSHIMKLSPLDIPLREVTVSNQ
ncbi:S-type anion channel [Nymphaea thermarum]|nr:S-type anion channel [Nymphaea thermarum]